MRYIGNTFPVRYGRKECVINEETAVELMLFSDFWPRIGLGKAVEV